MPSFEGQAFQLAVKISEGVRQRLLHEADRIRIAENKEIVTEGMVKKAAKKQQLAEYEQDFELLFTKPEDGEQS